MKFEVVYKKVINGTASNEEKAYLMEEAEKLNNIKSLLENDCNKMLDESQLVAKGPQIADADIETIKNARKKLNSQILWKSIIISMCSILTIAAIVCGIIFIPSISSAKRNEEIAIDDAVQIAEEYLSEYVDDVKDFYIDYINKELEINGHLNDSYYVYKIEFENLNRDEYKILVNAKSGYAILSDIDIRKR